MRIWNQGVARKLLLGEKSQNPTLAASALLRSLGKRRVTRALRRVSKIRRRFHKGNPAPALVAALGGKIFSGLGKRFRASSDKRAQGIAAGLVIAANQGNLTAARGLIERAAVPMNAKEKAVWAAAAGQLAPKIRASVGKYAELIPAADQSGPEQFAASVMAQPVSLTDIEAQAREELAARRSESSAATARREAAAERREARLLDVGGQIGAAVLGRSRRPSSRRRRRRSSARRFSF